MEWQSLQQAVMLILALLGGMAFERFLIRFGVRWYFRAGFPMLESLVPIQAFPEGEGRTPSVCWTVVQPKLVHFWADSALPEAMTGFHGVVYCVAGRAGIDLRIAWAPPWTPFLVLSWLFIHGASMGAITLVGPVCVGLCLILLAAYRFAALRAAAELRWSFVRDG